MLDDFERLLAEARSGSADAFSALYRDLSGPVCAYLRGRGMREAEDVTSEVFLAVFTGLHGFSGSQAQFRSWVFTIAHRRAVDVWRRSSRLPLESPYEPDEDLRTSPSAEGEALDALGERRVAEVLGELTQDQREVLVLRVVADLTVDQVAEVLGKQPGAVKALQRRGLTAVRRMLISDGVPL